MDTPTRKPKLFSATIVLMYVTALFWLLFAGYWLFRGSDYRYFFAITGFGYAIVLAGLTYYLSQKLRWAWWAAIVLAGLNIILTIADQVGWFDLAYLVPAIALLVMLLLSRKYVQPTAPVQPTL
jgi:lysylphosphatidylglycerol synthetase-like protein (DUF2156 family)